MIRRQAAIRDDARAYRREFLRVTTRWLLFLGRLEAEAPSPRPYATLLDDFERWMTDERGLPRGTLKNRHWHVGRFLDWLQERTSTRIYAKVDVQGLREVAAFDLGCRGRRGGHPAGRVR